ncbi:hypothetical protein SOCEGT47_022920 [Sorangium cellulosum]|uniref:Uncharacterized protein n=1 Tax=Sorangium cellulosum TaxID=56 RepID=A0A4P2PZ55_SORCE|nr:hypothetical protein [Sorangium cellulosum]AUX21803.1 hypothetical protein SOCEGT47_022920 [Sorangium cellulosum]
MTRPPDPEPREAPSERPGDPGRSRAALRNALRGAVALGCARLRSARGARLGAAMAAVISLGYGAMALVLRQDDGATSLDGLLGSAARGLAWAAAGPVALAAAHDRPAADRAEGVEALAAARGISRTALHGARSLAAMLEVARVVALPLAALSALAALLSGSAPLALRHLALGAALALFGAVSGVTLGGLAAASGRVAGARGRAVFAALILVPWALADLAGDSRWSIPGALDAFLSFAARSAGGSVG